MVDAIHTQSNVAPLEFGRFRIESGPERLLFDSQQVPISSQPLCLLRLLAERSGQLVTLDEIRMALWGERHIEAASNIHAAIKQVRTALRSVGNCVEIENVPRRGYRLLLVDQGRPDTKYVRRLIGMMSLCTILVSATAIVATRQPQPTQTSADQYARGIEAVLSHQPSTARKHLAAALDRRPDYAPAMIALARAERLDQQPERALVTAQDAVSLDPSSSKARYELAMAIAASLRDWSATERELRRALQFDPDQQDATIALAFLLEVDNRRAEMLEATNGWIDRFPTSHAHYMAAGRLAFVAGNYELAASLCDKARALRKASQAAQDCLAKIAILGGRAPPSRTPSGAESIIARFDRHLIAGDVVAATRDLSALEISDPILAAIAKRDPLFLALRATQHPKLF